MCCFLSSLLALACHRKGQGPSTLLPALLSPRALLSITHVCLSVFQLCCSLLSPIITATAHHHTPPRALPLRERTWIAHSAPVGRLSPNVVAWLSGFEGTCIYYHYHYHRLLPNCCRLLPGYFIRLGAKEEGLLGTAITDRLRGAPAALSIRSRGRETPRRSSQAKAENTATREIDTASCDLPNTLVLRDDLRQELEKIRAEAQDWNCFREDYLRTGPT